jgi:hypothetical protein
LNALINGRGMATILPKAPNHIISSLRDNASKRGLVRTNEKPLQTRKPKRGNANAPTLNIKKLKKKKRK